MTAKHAKQPIPTAAIPLIQPPAMQQDPAWASVMSARKEDRPQARDYIDKLFHGVFEVRGDQCMGDDEAIVTAVAWFETYPVTIIGQQKGHTLEERMRCNFGMPSPEGYRKSMRALKQAEKFHRPVICLVDTPGAFCGIEAEAKGQGRVIAEHLRAMAMVQTPCISIIIGEGGSGGALALSLADRLIMLEKERVIRAKDIDSKVTGRITGHPVRVLRSPLQRELAGAEYGPDGAVAVEKLGEGSLMRAVLHGDKERGSFMAGQCACMCDRVQPAAEIVRELFDPAAIKTALGGARTSLEADA